MEEATLRDIAKYKLLLRTRVIQKKKNKMLGLCLMFGSSGLGNKTLVTLPCFPVVDTLFWKCPRNVQSFIVSFKINFGTTKLAQAVRKSVAVCKRKTLEKHLSSPHQS